MKLYIKLISALILSIAVISCEKEGAEQEIILGSEIELTAIIDNGTKTSLSGAVSETGYNIVWNSHDAIAVVNNNKLYRFVISDSTANTSCGKFILDLSSLPANYKDGDFKIDMPIHAFYPYTGFEYDTVSRKMSYHVPHIQKSIIYKPSDQENGNVSFDDGIMPMAAYSISYEKNLVFKQLLASVKFVISGTEGEMLKNVEIVSNYQLNGIASVTISEGIGQDPVLLLDILKNQEEKIEGRNYTRISVDCGKDGIPISSPAEFIVTLPGNAKNLGIQLQTTTASYYQDINSSHASEGSGNILQIGQLHIVPDIKTYEKLPAYIDNGIYFGDGIKIPQTSDKSEYLLWAPVNCGYCDIEKIGGQIMDRGYVFGKLYQWGRKDGHGYTDVAYEDASYPTEVSTLGNGNPQEGKFYQDWKVDATEWPEESNPCPEGWRVPTIEELISLVKGLGINDYIIGLGSQWTSTFNDNNNRHYGQPGFIFYGNSTDTKDKLFLPAAGFYKNDMQENMIRGLSGCYWSSTSTGSGIARYMDFNRKGYIDTFYDNQACGRSVRCVKNEIVK